MAKKADTKTNAMRELEDARITYDAYEYDTGGTVPSGTEAARLMGLAENEVFKTLVTRGRSGGFYVFCIPGGAELDLKKAARAVGEKNIEMIPQKDLFARTGYIHGGCSPLAMKKRFPTVLADQAKELDSFVVSGGRIGLSVRVSPEELARHLGASFADVVRV